MNAAAILWNLALRGSAAVIVVVTLDWLARGRMRETWRRVWWVAVPLAFLFPIHWGLLSPSAAGSRAWLNWFPDVMIGQSAVARDTALPALPARAGYHWLAGIWLAGAVGYLAFVIWQTWLVSRKWARSRLSTDGEMLDLLETCKTEAGVTAPIGVVISADVSTPALLGWLRPRILIPESVARSLSRSQLRGVFLHELAHFRRLDIPLGWLFIAARAVHWFNPLVHLAAWRWSGFREEAADEAAVMWMREPSGETYGEALIAAIRQRGQSSKPFGGLAIGESLQSLKRRIIMIDRHYRKTSWHMLGITIASCLAMLVLIRPLRAEDASADSAKQAAVAAMQTWLQTIDDGHYAQSWDSTAELFKKAISSEKWNLMLTQIRSRLGQLKSRTLASALYETKVPDPHGGIREGEFVIAQFNTSFENLDAARETVTFKKEADGAWHAAGYYIKPRL